MEVKKHFLTGTLIFVLTMCAVSTFAASQNADNNSSNDYSTIYVAYPMIYETIVLPSTTVFQADSEISSTEPTQISEGKPGKIIRTYMSVGGIDEEGDRLLVNEIIIPAQNTVYAVSTRGYQPLASRGSFVRKRTMTMEATAYDPSPASNGGYGGRTASGMRAGYGVVAVDPRVIPMHTKLYIEGYGWAIAGDTGGAIKGNRIDLCLATNREAMKFGRRKVKVHVLR